MSTYHQEGPQLDPSTPEAEIAEFVAVIRGALGAIATESHGPAGGYQWQWPQRGLWTITAGAVLDPDPVIAGPAGEWRIYRTDRAGAEAALQALFAAGALPSGVFHTPPPLLAPPGGLYGAARVPDDRRPDHPPAAAGEPILLRPNGPRQGDMQPVLGPGGGPAMVNARSGGNFVTALGRGQMGAVVVRPFAGLGEGEPIPAMLYPADNRPAFQPTMRPAAPGLGDGRPSPRPAARQPGANTGARPQPAWAGGRGWPHERVDQLPAVDLPVAGMGPGAAYAPEVIRDDRDDVRPDCAPMVVAGSDLPARDSGPLTPIDDTGRGQLPEYGGGYDSTPTESSPAYGGGDYNAGPADSAPAGGCD